MIRPYHITNHVENGSDGRGGPDPTRTGDFQSYPNIVVFIDRGSSAGFRAKPGRGMNGLNGSTMVCDKLNLNSHDPQVMTSVR